MALYRISFLCLYLRIFLDKTFRVLCKIGITFTALCNVAFILVTIFQCVPVSAIWDKTVEPATCIKSKAFWFSYAMINIVSDVTILALPIPQILKLHLSWRNKLGLIAVFMMGSLYSSRPPFQSPISLTVLIVFAQLPLFAPRLLLGPPKPEIQHVRYS